jgi:hypothetical protein
MKPEIVIAFDVDGTARAVQTDLFPLGAIGRQTQRRASTVEWNEGAQVWEVRWQGSPAVAYSNPSRAECVAWEVRQLQAAL